MTITLTGGTMRILLHRSAGSVLRALLPAACSLCGANSGDMLCDDCAAQFFGSAAAVARCACCANPLPGAISGSGNGGADISAPIGSGIGSGIGSVSSMGGGQSGTGLPLCGACVSDPPAFDLTVVAADYAMPVDQLVLQLKFGHRLALAALLARLLRDAIAQRSGLVLPSLLCPVPLGPRRLAERGYNQALEIARPLSRSLGVALHPRLASRVLETAAQSSVAPDQRQRNIAGAFAIPDMALVQGRHIGVVDDVMTSGRTLNELAATLKRHGAARVSNFVFARTPPH